MSSPAETFPEGRYFSTPIDMGVEKGGETRALLMRNRIFVTEVGLRPVVLTFSPRVDWHERREAMLDSGMLLPEIATPNLYEHYRERGWPDGEALDRTAQTIDVSGWRRVEETSPEGSPWRVVYQDLTGHTVAYDYLRGDGTAYLRIPEFSFAEPTSWPGRIEQLGSAGEVVGSFSSLGQWFRLWIREMTAGERSFVFVDSRFSAPHILPMRARHVHTIYMLHNMHLLSPRHWSSRTTKIYSRVLQRIPGMDAMVTLTERQRDDIALRRGRTNNLFVAPNPVEVPEAVGDPRHRDPHRVVIVARLENQKGLRDAIAAFDIIHRRVPQARLDIYGRGGQREILQRAISDRGLDDCVVLHGHDPHAREALRHASAFMMTSSYEGWNLAMQESMSYGCPVVSYDIKYGPREQIEDGVNGFLVPHRDTAAMADRVVELLESPDLSARISAAALERASSSKTRCVQDWKHILEAVVDLKPRRTRLRQVTLDIETLRVDATVARRRGPRGRGPSFVQASAGPEAALRFAAKLTVDADATGSDLGTAELTLSAVHADTGSLTDLPLRVRRDDSRFSLETEVSLAQVVADAPRGAEVSLRLMLVWGNAAWQTDLSRPEGGAAAYEVTYDPQDRFQVRART